MVHNCVGCGAARRALVTGLDRDAFLWVVEHRLGPLDPVFVALSVVGYAGLVWIALAAVLAARARTAPLRTLAVTALCVWGVDLASLAVKAAVDRPRPFEKLSEADPLLRGTIGSSLPSGHAATAAAGAVILVVLLRHAAPALVLLAAAIAYSRVYVGVHYPADVLAGAGLGAVFSLAAVAVLRSRLPPAAGLRGSGGPRPRG